MHFYWRLHRQLLLSIDRIHIKLEHGRSKSEVGRLKIEKPTTRGDIFDFEKNIFWFSILKKIFFELFFWKNQNIPFGKNQGYVTSVMFLLFSDLIDLICLESRVYSDSVPLTGFWEWTLDLVSVRDLAELASTQVIEEVTAW